MEKKEEKKKKALEEEMLDEVNGGYDYPKIMILPN